MNGDKGDKETGLERESGEGQNKRKREERARYLGRNWSPHFWVEIIRDSWADI